MQLIVSTTDLATLPPEVTGEAQSQLGLALVQIWLPRRATVTGVVFFVWKAVPQCSTAPHPSQVVPPNHPEQMKVGVHGAAKG